MQVYAAPDEIKVPGILTDYYVDGRFDYKHAQEVDAKFKDDLRTWVKANGQPHKLSGEVVSVPFADGNAEYMVFKWNGKVGLIHIPLGDAWQDARFERLATVAELTRMVEAEKRFRAAWARAAERSKATV